MVAKGLSSWVNVFEDLFVLVIATFRVSAYDQNMWVCGEGVEDSLVLRDGVISRQLDCEVRIATHRCAGSFRPCAVRPH